MVIMEIYSLALTFWVTFSQDCMQAMLETFSKRSKDKLKTCN